MSVKEISSQVDNQQTRDSVLTVEQRQKVEKLQHSDFFSAYCELIDLKNMFSELSFAIVVDALNRDILNMDYSQEEVDAAVRANGRIVDITVINQVITNSNITDA